MNDIVIPACEADTAIGDAVIVPDPSAASTVIAGDAAIEVRTPAAVEASCTCHVCAPGVDGAVAVPPDPYVMATVCAGGARDPGDGDRLARDGDASRRWLVVKPGPATVEGGVQPAGTSTVSEPFSMPPVAARVRERDGAAGLARRDDGDRGGRRCRSRPPRKR